jgi:hypothetical protein
MLHLDMELHLPHLDDDLPLRLKLKPGERWAECQSCTLEFRARRSDARYCSKRCRQNAWRDNNAITTLTLNLDAYNALVLQAIADEHGMSRQQFVTELLNSFVEHAMTADDA